MPSLRSPNIRPDTVSSLGELRRAPIRVFRYHLLYRIKADQIRILVLRHTHRRPTFGLSRQ